MPDPVQQLKSAVNSGDGAKLRELLAQDAEVRARINDPVFAFDSPAIVAVAGRGNRGIIDALLDAGADINGRSHWWAGSFGVLDSAEPELAAYLIKRGARLDIHSAARLGKLDEVRAFVEADAHVVHARGGDGKTALHFAATVEIAAYLLDHGADIDARDIDHESTAAQHLIRERPDVVRFLIQRGCETDILMAAALGEAVLVRNLLERDPESIRMRVDDRYFGMKNPRAGGTIYIWTLGKYKTALQLARESGNREVLELLMSRSDATPDVKLINACWAVDRTTAQEVLAAHPGLASALPAEDRHQVTEAAELNKPDVVRLMLESGWPVNGGVGTTPLHFAAWHGNAGMVRTILEYRPALEEKDPAFHATPLGWAIHGSEHSWHSKTGDYRAVVEMLLAAGAQRPAQIEGSEAVRAALSITRRPPA